MDRILQSQPDPADLAAPQGARRHDSREDAKGALVRFEIEGEAPREIRLRPGVTLLEAARAADADLRSYCGGNCSCGTCRVEILDGARNLSRMEDMEAFALSAEHHAKGRLACQARVMGDVKVKIPEFF